MDPKTLEYISRALVVFQAAVETLNLVSATLQRISATNGAPVTDADLEALEAQRRDAVDRFAKLVG